MQEQQQPQYNSSSPPINFVIPTQLNAPNTARQLSQATMHFDGIQLDHQFPRRSSMPEQLNLVSPPRSPPLNALANGPLAPNPPQAHINVPALSSPVLNPVPPHFPFIPTAFCLDKLSSFPPLNMHNNDNIINYSATLSSLVGVFKSLSYHSDL